MDQEPLTTQHAYDHAWKYFALHAGQRMQSVHFFLIASTFLAAGHVAAIGYQRPGLAAGIAVIGIVVSLTFYRIERRVRGMIKAAEAALRLFEDRFSASMDDSHIRILDIVEAAPAGAWPYSRVFRTLYIAFGTAFGVGAIHAIALQLAITPATTSLFEPVLRLGALSVLLMFSYEIWVARGDQETGLAVVTRLSLVVASAAVALYLAVRLG